MTHELEFTFADAPWLLALGFAIGLLTYLPDGVRVMKRLILSLLLVALVAVPLSAQWSYQKTLADVTVAGTAANVFSSADVLAGSGHAQATQAVCTLVTANIRVTFDGTTPTTSLGTVLTPGIWFFTGTPTLLNLQAIRDDSTSGVLSCSIYGQ